MRVTEERVEIFLHRGKAFRMSIIPLIFVVIGMLMLVVPQSQAEFRKNLPIALMAILFFGLFLVIGLARLFRRRPALILDENGLTDLIRQKKPWSIAWRDVGAVYQSTLLVHKAVLLEPLNQAEHLAELSPRMQKLQGKTPIARTFLDTELPPDELERVIKDMWMKHRYAHLQKGRKSLL